MLGFGLSLGDLAIRQRGGQAPLALLPALVTPGARYRTVASTERLIAGYAGPLAAVAGPGGAAVDLGAGVAGLAAADLPVGGAPLVRWYDQSGGGRDLVPAAPAEAPRLRAGVGVGARGGVLFTGRAGDAARRSTLVGASAGTSAGRTDVLVLHPSTSRQAALFTEQLAAGGQVIDNTGVEGDAAHGRLGVAGAEPPGSVHAGPQVLLVVRDGAGVTLWRDGAKGPTTPSPLGDAPVASVLVGADRDGQGYNANMRLGALALVDRALGDTDAAAVSAALMARFALTPCYLLNLVHLGDSIVEGVQASDTLGLGQQLLPLLGVATRYWNLGVAGKTLMAMNADRADQIPGLLAPARRNVAVVDGGINDLNAGPAATGDALYASATAPLVAYLKGLGFAVAVTTILPAHTGHSYDDDAVDAQRRRYNDAVRANAAGADAVVDRAAESRMGAYPAGPDDPALYADALHPTSAGYALLAPVYAAALRGLAGG